jgi:hypothetical protein
VSTPQALLRAEAKHAPVRWLAALQQMIRSKRKSAAPRVGFCIVAVGALSGRLPLSARSRSDNRPRMPLSFGKEG